MSGEMSHIGHHRIGAVALVSSAAARNMLRLAKIARTDTPQTVLALTQLGAPLVTDTMAGDVLESGPTDEAAITPSGYAFGIWALICVLSVLTTVGVLYFGLGAAWEVDVLVTPPPWSSVSAHGSQSPRSNGCGPAWSHLL